MLWHTLIEHIAHVFASWLLVSLVCFSRFQPASVQAKILSLTLPLRWFHRYLSPVCVDSPVDKPGDYHSVHWIQTVFLRCKIFSRRQAPSHLMVALRRRFCSLECGYRCKLKSVDQLHRISGESIHESYRHPRTSRLFRTRHRRKARHRQVGGQLPYRPA